MLVDKITNYNIYRKPILPIERNLLDSNNSDSNSNESDNDNEDVTEYYEKMIDLKRNLFSKADENIKEAQARQKKDYDKKHHRKKVCS